MAVTPTRVPRVPGKQFPGGAVDVQSRPCTLQLSMWLLVGTVISLAVVGATVGAVTTPLRPAELGLFAMLLAGAVVSVEATRRLGEPAGINANDLLSAWWLPIAVLLPPVYSLLAPLPILVLTQLRVRRAPWHRRYYSAAAIGLGYATASLAIHAGPGALRGADLIRAPYVSVTAVAGAALVGLALNSVLIGLAVRLSDPEASWRDALVVDTRVEVAELCAGVVVAVLVAVTPALIVVVLPLLLLLQQGMMHAQLRAAARTDPKTGLLNAVTWEREAATELSSASRGRRSTAVLLLDLDHFKQVNDRHGHLVGDQALRSVASALRGQLRDGDLLGRFGGEEFAVLLPNADAAEAARVAERLRKSVAELRIVTPTGATVAVTASVGVAVLHGAVSVAEALAGADERLYRAKSQGRDRVLLAG